ncbi:hypothetical protein HYPSUDRAFT_639117 [Hypholoma sublateritium FD-334 SS-4]|uniref:Uncharacterized protein n=1 Tax=Hypholoma sublateritium (strain FD-334 SS-4) TaxID=945553 RepID=A0A0D2L6Z9_HYPSF|nr:hypothetical protein HYPSUDRAFT_639117 [Hypholoma sublateritium FD-334 SS-4]
MDLPTVCQDFGDGVGGSVYQQQLNVIIRYLSETGSINDLNHVKETHAIMDILARIEIESAIYTRWERIKRAMKATQTNIRSKLQNQCKRQGGCLSSGGLIGAVARKLIGVIRPTRTTGKSVLKAIRRKIRSQLQNRSRRQGGSPSSGGLTRAITREMIGSAKIKRTVKAVQKKSRTGCKIEARDRVEAHRRWRVIRPACFCR